MSMRAMLSCAVRHAAVASVSATVHTRKARTFHASAVALARQSRRGGRVAKAASAKPIKPSPFEDDDNEDYSDDDDEEIVGKARNVKKATFFTKDELDKNPNLLDEDDDDEEEDDEETKKFLEGVEDLFMLDEKQFGRRLVQAEPLEGDNADNADADDEGDEKEIDRAERIPKKRLLKVLDDFDAMKPRGGKNAEGIRVPKTKAAAPLEKKEKRADADRISYRQERVEETVMAFVQHLLAEDSDLLDTNVFAHLVDASVSPDLRRVVLYWDPVRRNSENQTIAKKKVEGVQKRLDKMEKFIRVKVTRHLNLKYSPVIQFKRYKQPKSEQVRALFDQEMAWLDQFK